MPFTEEQLDRAAEHLVQRTARRLEAREDRRAQLLDRLPRAARMLRDQFGARRIVLVGSLDAPWFTEQSDVDLVVEGISSGRAGFAEERTVELLGVRVDLLRYEELDESFREVVAREGRQIS